MQYQGAIFDVDGVLVDSPHELAWCESLQQLMEGPWHSIVSQTNYTPERFTTEVYLAHVAGKPREAGARAALDYFGVPDPADQRLQEYCDTKQDYLIKLVEQGRFVAFDDALHLLLTLKVAGLHIGAASSSKNANLFLQNISIGAFLAQGGMAKAAYQPADLAERLGAFVGAATTLLDLFDANVCGRDFARGKPDPEIFLTAAAELQLAPEVCVVIEDATSGVQAAKAGGMSCVGIARLNDEHLLREAGADWVVTDLDQLPITSLIE